MALVIAYYLELSHDLPAYGIEGECVAWRKEAVKQFKKGNLDPDKGLFATKLRIEKLEEVDASEEETDEETDEEEGNVTTVQAPPAAGTAENPVTLDDDDTDKENKEPKPITSTCVSPPLTPKGKRKRNVHGAQNKDTDPFKWATKFAAYKEGHYPKMGGQQYDITKMSRVDREAVAFDGKDPLADIPAKALRENLLDLA